MNNRNNLLKKLASNSICIIVGNEEKVRSLDTMYPFRQDSNFYYLTDFNEPNAVALITNNKQLPTYTLFVNPKNCNEEQWTGVRAGIDGAKQEFGANEAYDINQIEEILPQYLQHCENYYYSFGINHKFDHKFLRAFNKIRNLQRKGIQLPENIKPLENIMAELRLYKTADEIKLMQKAADISSNAHLDIMQNIKNYTYEYQVHANLVKHFMQNNAREAYTSIVGGGKNACILHYIDNNQKLNSGDLLLIDAGCEYNYYASDITRTFPINGKFSPEQKAIYDIVLEAQLAGIEQVKPNVPWDKIQEAIVKVIQKGLKALNINIDYSEVYMHKSGHWLGLDTHDVGAYKLNNNWIELKPNMVLTVEPGIYIGQNPKIDKKWWNIGVRIEDDLLVTAENHLSLSNVIKDPLEIEKLY